MNLYPDPPATLGSTAAASARIVVWCRACNYQVEPDPTEQAQRYGAETSVHALLGCSPDRPPVIHSHPLVVTKL